jgi:hypothetical protein
VRGFKRSISHVPSDLIVAQSVHARSQFRRTFARQGLPVDPLHQGIEPSLPLLNSLLAR